MDLLNGLCPHGFHFGHVCCDLGHKFLILIALRLSQLLPGSADRHLQIPHPLVPFIQRARATFCRDCVPELVNRGYLSCRFASVLRADRQLRSPPALYARLEQLPRLGYLGSLDVDGKLILKLDKVPEFGILHVRPGLIHFLPEAGHGRLWHARGDKILFCLIENVSQSGSANVVADIPAVEHPKAHEQRAGDQRFFGRCPFQIGREIAIHALCGDPERRLGNVADDAEASTKQSHHGNMLCRLTSGHFLIIGHPGRDFSNSAHAEGGAGSCKPGTDLCAHVACPGPLEAHGGLTDDPGLCRNHCRRHKPRQHTSQTKSGLFNARSEALSCRRRRCSEKRIYEHLHSGIYGSRGHDTLSRAIYAMLFDQFADPQVDLCFGHICSGQFARIGLLALREERLPS